jgi:hypothetical protein
MLWKLKTRSGAALQPDAGSAPSRCTRCNAPFAPIEDDDNGLCVKCSLNPRPTKTAAGVGYSELKKQRDTLQDMLLQVTKQCDKLKAKLTENEESREQLENERKLSAEFSRRLETFERMLKESEVNLAGARAEREAVQKREAAMREALERADSAIWDAHYGHGIAVEYARNTSAAIKAALQPDAGRDYIHKDKAQSQLDAMAAVVKSAYVHKDQVKPLVEALEGIVGHCVHPDEAVRSVMVDLKPIRTAIAHAKSIGLDCGADYPKALTGCGK